MLSATLALDDASGDEVSYVSIVGAPGESRRIDAASTLTEPKLLVIKHTTSGKGADVVDRHLVQFSQTEEGAGGTPRTAVVNFTMAVPRDSAITSAMIYDLASNLIDLIADGSFSSSGIGGTTNLAALLRGEG